MIPFALAFTMEHFPEHKTILEILYRQNESFRSLCEDFRDCVRAKEYWWGSFPDNENALSLCKEYEALCADLKNEITQWLKANEERT